MTKTILIAVAVFLTATSVSAFECKNPVDSLARVAYYEARGEGNHGMRLVVEVALNRVESSKFPDTLCGVVKQRGQFSWVGKTRSAPRGDAWERAKQIARETLREGTRHTDALYFRAGGGSEWMGRSRKVKYKSHSFY